MGGGDGQCPGGREILQQPHGRQLDPPRTSREGGRRQPRRQAGEGEERVEAEAVVTEGAEPADVEPNEHAEGKRREQQGLDEQADRRPGGDRLSQQPVDREAERQDEGYPRQRAVGHDLDADPGGGERHGGPLQRRQPLAQEDEAEEHADQRARSEEHTSELQSLMRISYAVLCLKKKTKYDTQQSKQHTYTQT